MLTMFRLGKWLKKKIKIPPFTQARSARRRSVDFSRPAAECDAQGLEGSIAQTQGAVRWVGERFWLRARDYEAQHSAGSFPEAEARGAGQGRLGVGGG